MIANKAPAGTLIDDLIAGHRSGREFDAAWAPLNVNDKPGRRRGGT